MFNPETVWPVFVAIWIALMVIGFFVFHVSRNAARKRRLFPWFAVGAGILFAVFTWTAGFPLETVLVIMPFVALISWLNIRQTRFCAVCGRTAMTFSLGTMPRYCQHCGAALKEPGTPASR